MKVLIIRFSSIGDIVLTTPVIRVLKTGKESTIVHFATKKAYAGLLAANPYLDKIHLLENGLFDLFKQLKAENFDLIIDLHNNLRSNLLRLMLWKKSVGYNKLNLRKWFMVSLKINLLPARHLVDRYMDTIGHLGLKMDNLGLDYFIPEKDEVEKDWLPDPFQDYFVAVVIAGGWNTKKLPVERLIELCDRINKPIILIGGEKEKATGDQVEAFFRTDQGDRSFDEGLKELGKKAQVYNACGKFSFNQSASLVRQARWVFTHDTGLMHVAAAFKKEIFTIWGNTIPEFGMYPYRTKFTIFENKKLKCRPCSKIGFSKCPKGHFRCMREVVFDFYLPD